MITISRTDSENKDFQDLVHQLDTDLAERNGEKNDFFAQFNKTNLIKNVIVAYSNNIPVGCGAIKIYDSNIMEVKRMFVLKEQRGKKYANKQYQNDHYNFDQYSGKILKSQSYQDKNIGMGTALRERNYDLHTGTIIGTSGRIIYFFASIIAFSLPVSGLIIYLNKRKKKK